MYIMLRYVPLCRRMIKKFLNFNSVRVRTLSHSLFTAVSEPNF
jgi:hypothetical protein